MTDEISEERIKIDAQQVAVLPFKQWLPTWDDFNSVKSGEWKKPEPTIYLFSMKAGVLRSLSDVYRRKYVEDKSEGLQRAQDRSRTAKIQRYVKFGYPYGDLPEPQRTSANAHLRKPGWLPTAIVVNILGSGERRRGKTVNDNHIVTITQADGHMVLDVPEIDSAVTDYLAPFEVIDGQHRLWAFDGGDTGIPDDFELPVVAYVGLDIPWQAYLFWSINVSPKKINRSHAFDLYPLLRTQDWLEQVGELNVYREARAQELTELLYAHSESAWHHRINMLGEKGGGSVSQNAWVKALTSSFLATGRGTGNRGLFQGNIGMDDSPLPWSRAQQGALLIEFWSQLKSSIAEGPAHWWIRQYKGGREHALTDKTSLLNQDMGLRAVLSVLNDVLVERADQWHLFDWRTDPSEDSTLMEEATLALKSLRTTALSTRLATVAASVAAHDWRSLEGPGVKGSDDEVLKRSYRGSGGYTALKTDLLKTFVDQNNELSPVANELLGEN